MSRQDSIATDSDMNKVADRFYDSWRKLRRGSASHKIALHLLKAPDCTMNSSESDILQVIARLESGSLIEIAQQAYYDPGNVTRTVTQLENKGFVIRTSQKGTGRALSVKLTAKGEEVVHELRHRRAVIFEVAMSKLSQKQRRDLVDLLDQVTQSLDIFATPAGTILLSAYRPASSDQSRSRAKKKGR